MPSVRKNRGLSPNHSFFTMASLPHGGSMSRSGADSHVGTMGRLRHQWLLKL